MDFPRLGCIRITLFNVSDWRGYRPLRLMLVQYEQKARPLLSAATSKFIN